MIMLQLFRIIVAKDFATSYFLSLLSLKIFLKVFIILLIRVFISFFKELLYLCILIVKIS